MEYELANIDHMTLGFPGGSFLRRTVLLRLFWFLCSWGRVLGVVLGVGPSHVVRWPLGAVGVGPSHGFDL